MDMPTSVKNPRHWPKLLRHCSDTARHSHTPTLQGSSHSRAVWRVSPPKSVYSVRCAITAPAIWGDNEGPLSFQCYQAKGSLVAQAPASAQAGMISMLSTLLLVSLLHSLHVLSSALGSPPRDSPKISHFRQNDWKEFRTISHIRRQDRANPGI